MLLTMSVLVLSILAQIILLKVQSTVTCPLIASKTSLTFSSE